MAGRCMWVQRPAFLCYKIVNRTVFYSVKSQPASVWQAAELSKLSKVMNTKMSPLFTAGVTKIETQGFFGKLGSFLGTVTGLSAIGRGVSGIGSPSGRAHRDYSQLVTATAVASTVDGKPVIQLVETLRLPGDQPTRVLSTVPVDGGLKPEQVAQITAEVNAQAIGYNVCLEEQSRLTNQLVAAVRERLDIALEEYERSTAAAKPVAVEVVSPAVA